MRSSDFRKTAREKLTGKWGTVAVISLLYSLVSFILTVIENSISEDFSSFFSIIEYVIEIPLAFGLLISFLKLYNGESVGSFDFFTEGFSNFKRSWLLTLNTALKMILPVILFIISLIIAVVSGVGSVVYNSARVSTLGSSASTGFPFISLILLFVSLAAFVWIIVKSYNYALSNLIGIEHPEMSAKEAVETSAEIMNGNKGKLFCLQFSFIGWAILSALTFGIGVLWLLPYVQFAVIAFYKHLSGDNSNATTFESPIETNANNMSNIDNGNSNE